MSCFSSECRMQRRLSDAPRNPAQKKENGTAAPPAQSYSRCSLSLNPKPSVHHRGPGPHLPPTRTRPPSTSDYELAPSLPLNQGSSCGCLNNRCSLTCSLTIGAPYPPSSPRPPLSADPNSATFHVLLRARCLALNQGSSRGCWKDLFRSSPTIVTKCSTFVKCRQILKARHSTPYHKRIVP